MLTDLIIKNILLFGAFIWPVLVDAVSPMLCFLKCYEDAFIVFSVDTCNYIRLSYIRSKYYLDRMKALRRSRQ